MSQGSMRCDANVSIMRPEDKEYGIRAEIKNINSFKFVEKARENKLLTIKAADNVVRLLPPLNISEKDCNEAIDKIRNTCKYLT